MSDIIIIVVLGLSMIPSTLLLKKFFENNSTSRHLEDSDESDKESK